MSKPLPEKYIQQRAVEFLAAYYQNCSHNKKIEHVFEAHTKQNKRADGLIFWERAADKVRVVSVEAKSATTIRNLLTRWDEVKISKDGYYVALGIMTMLFCLAYGVFDMRLPYDLPTLLLTFIVLTLVWWLTQWMLQTFFPRFFKTAGVLEQATRYPGNEVWIAIGYDTFKRERAARLKELRIQCRRRKFGLLEIHQDGYPHVILEKPRFNRVLKVKDFLAYYKNEQRLRQLISGHTRRFLPIRCISKAEFNFWFRRQKIAGLFTLVFLGLNFLNLDKPHLPNSYTQQTIFPKEKFGPPLPPLTVQPKAPKAEILIPPPEEKSVKQADNYTCLPFPYEGKRFILIDQLVSSMEEAESRMNQLTKAGCPGNGYFWIPCSDSTNQEELWCVFAYKPRNSEGAIDRRKKSYKYLLRKAGLERGMMVVWEVGAKESET